MIRPRSKTFILQIKDSRFKILSLLLLHFSSFFSFSFFLFSPLSVLLLLHNVSSARRENCSRKSIQPVASFQAAGWKRHLVSAADTHVTVNSALTTRSSSTANEDKLKVEVHGEQGIIRNGTLCLVHSFPLLCFAGQASIVLPPTPSSLYLSCGVICSRT